MYRIRPLLIRILVLSLLASLLASCGVLSMFLPGKGGGGSDPDPFSERSVGFYIDEATTLLKTGDTLTLAQSDQARAAARSKVGSANLVSEDMLNYAELAVEGAVASVGTMGFSDDAAKIDAVNAIVTAYVAALEGQLEIIASSGGSARSISAKATVVSGFLARISRAAVKSIQLAGVSAENQPEATGRAIGSIVESLGTGGLTREYINPTVGAIAKSAVDTLVDAGMTSTEAQILAIQRISSSAVQAATNTGVAGVQSADVGDLVSSISKGTSSGAATLAGGDQTAAQALVQAASTGAVSGISNALAAQTIQSDSVAILVGKSTEGASAGVSASTTNAATAASLVGVVTQAVSTSATAIAGQDASSMVVAIAKAASEGAQTFEGGIPVDILKTAIILKDSSSGTAQPVTMTTELETKIAEGVSAGTNVAPVAVAGPDRNATVGVAVQLSGSGSSDTETVADDLVYFWSLVQRPAASSLEWTATGIEVEFVADVVTSATEKYLIMLRVTDGGGKSHEDFCEIAAALAPGEITIDGLTAVDRLEAVRPLFNQGRFTEARDALLFIVNKYDPVPEVFPEALFLLAESLNNLNQKDAAIARYVECYTKYPADQVWTPRAKIGPAWINVRDELKRPASIATFNEVRTTYPGSYAAFDAQAALGYCDFLNGQHESARTKLNAVLGVLNDAEHARILDWVPLVIGMSYANGGSVNQAIDHYNSIINRSFYTGKSFNPQSRTIGDAAHNLIQILRFQDEEALRTLLLTIAEDTLLEPFKKMNVLEHGYSALYYEFADSQNDTVIMDEVVSALQAALTVYEGGSSPDPRGNSGAAWAYNTLGNIYGRKADMSSGETRTTHANSAIAFFQKIIDSYPAADNYRIAGHARAGIVGLYLWQLNDLVIAEARAREYAAIAYPSDAHPAARALAASRLGRVLQRKGWNARNNAGQDYISYFNEAIYWFERATPAYNPGLAETEWFVLEARRQRVDCLTGLYRYAEARSAANALLGTSGYSDRDKAWIALTVVDSYRNEIAQYSNNENFAAVIAIGNNLQIALDKVASYKDGLGNFVDNGRPYAEALARVGQAVANFTSRLRWSDLTSWGGDLSGAADYGVEILNLLFDPETGLPRAEFVNLNPADWFFYDSRVYLAQLYKSWGAVDSSKYTDAINVLQSLVESFEDIGYSPRSRLVWLYREFADVYNSRGRLIDLHAIMDVEGLSAVTTAYENALSDFGHAATIYGLAFDLEENGEMLDPEDQVRSAVDAGRINRHMLELARRYHGDFGIPASQDQGLQMQEWYDNGVQQLQAVIADPANLSLDSGGVVQRAWRFLGEINTNAAWLYRTVMEDQDKNALRFYFQESVDAYRTAANEGTFNGVDTRDISAARSNLVMRLIDLADMYNPWESESLTEAYQIAATALFDEAYDEWAQLMTGAIYEDGERVWATLELGNGVKRLWNLLKGKLSAGEDMDSIQERLEVGLQLFSVILDEYSLFEQGRVAAEALYFTAELYETVARDAEVQGNLSVALGYWDEGISLLDRLLTDYGDRTDWWVVDDTRNEKRGIFLAERARVAGL